MKAPEKRIGQGTGSRWNPPDKEWLEYHYTTLGKSALEIAYEVGAGQSGQQVRCWLERAGLEVRQYHHPSPPKEWLEQQYLVSKKSAATIAREVGVDGGTVLKWLHDAGIPTRSKGQRFAGKRPWRRYNIEQLLGTDKPYECEWCGQGDIGPRSIHVHHKDHNRENNDLSNLQFLCSTCHTLERGIWYAHKRGKVVVEVREGVLVLRFPHLETKKEDI